MKLWILRPVDPVYLSKIGNPWAPWCDKNFGFVIRAETETEARNIANEEAESENRGKIQEPWKNVKYSTCEELLPTGKVGVVIRDFERA